MEVWIFACDRERETETVEGIKREMLEGYTKARKMGKEERETQTVAFMAVFVASSMSSPTSSRHWDQRLHGPHFCDSKTNRARGGRLMQSVLVSNLND